MTTTEFIKRLKDTNLFKSVELKGEVLNIDEDEKLIIGEWKLYKRPNENKFITDVKVVKNIRGWNFEILLNCLLKNVNKKIFATLDEKQNRINLLIQDFLELEDK